MLAACVYIALQPGVPAVARHLCYALCICGFVTLLMDLPAVLLSGALGLECIPSFSEPWLSSSLASFWGARWNIPTASLLRCVVGAHSVGGQAGGCLALGAGIDGHRRA
jgi:hypothetical protein